MDESPIAPPFPVDDRTLRVEAARNATRLSSAASRSRNGTPEDPVVLAKRLYDFMKGE